MTPKITIAIPVYNRQDLISVAIESVLPQLGQDAELVIVDNNSTDRTYEVAQSYVASNVRVYRNDSNIGFTRNCIKCIECANGEWLRFLMSDDIFLPGALDLMRKIMRSNPDVDILFSKGTNGDKIADRQHRQEVEIISAEEYNTLQRHWRYYRFPAMPNAYAIKTSRMKEMVIDELFLQISKELEFGHCVDYLMLAYNARKSKRIAIINIPTYRIAIHDQEESFRYRNNIALHLSGDYVVVSQMYAPSFFEKFYFYEHALKIYRQKLKSCFKQSIQTMIFMSIDFFKVMALIILSHLGILSEKVYKS